MQKNRINMAGLCVCARHGTPPLHSNRYAILGQAATGNKESYIQSYCYKFWSGNYNHAFYVFSPSGKRKLDAVIADKASALHKVSVY